MTSRIFLAHELISRNRDTEFWGQRSWMFSPKCWIPVWPLFCMSCRKPRIRVLDDARSLMMEEKRGEKSRSFSGRGDLCLRWWFVALKWVEQCVAPSDKAYELLLSVRACCGDEVRACTAILYFVEIKTILGPACRPRRYLNCIFSFQLLSLCHL